MKKLITISSMALALVFTASMAFGASLTLPVAWFVNDTGGVFFSNEDTWMTLKNNTDFSVTLELDFYDDDNVTAIATTDTITIGPRGVYAYYTGWPAFSGDVLGRTGFGMGDGCERGSIAIRFDSPAPEYTKARQVLTGYMTIDLYQVPSSYGINFVYSDD